MKKLFTLLLSLAMLVSLAVPAFATELEGAYTQEEINAINEVNIAKYAKSFVDAVSDDPDLESGRIQGLRGPELNGKRPPLKGGRFSCILNFYIDIKGPVPLLVIYIFMASMMLSEWNISLICYGGGNYDNRNRRNIVS